MIEGIQLKVCGLTSLVDAGVADECGADFLGFILYKKSPRHVSVAQFRAMQARLPARHKVAVTVEPEPEELVEMKEAGFDRFQVHFRHDVPISRLQAWSIAVGQRSLWLAPKLPPAVEASEAWFELSQAIVLDTFDPNLFGGTGRTGDWEKFNRHRKAHPRRTWILSGGLNPENIQEALHESGARFIDVNSGIESAPGVKDHARLKAFVQSVRKTSRR